MARPIRLIHFRLSRFLGATALAVALVVTGGVGLYRWGHSAGVDGGIKLGVASGQAFARIEFDKRLAEVKQGIIDDLLPEFEHHYTRQATRMWITILKGMDTPKFEPAITYMENLYAAAEDLPQPTQAGGYIGETGFCATNVSLHESGEMTRVMGEITNDATAGVSGASFTVNAYGENKRLIARGTFVLFNMSSGEKKTFEAILDVPLAKIITHNIQCETALPAEKGRTP